MQDALILCRFAHFAAVLLLFGGGLFRGALFASLLHGFETSRGRTTADRGQVWLTITAMLSAAAWLMLTAASLGDGWGDAIDPQTLSLVLGNTFFGHVWMVHLGLGAASLALALRTGGASGRLALMVNGLLLLTLAPVGHGAMFDGVQGALLILNQMLHLLGVSLWLGSLMMIWLLLARPLSIDLRAILMRFSGIGYGLVAMIVITGLINVRALSGAPWPAPALSGFGLVLAFKVAMVLCMLVVAMVNRQLAGRTSLPVSALRRSVRLECLFGALALAAVSLLGTLPPMLA